MMVTSPWLIDSEIISKFTVNAQAVNSWLECELVQGMVRKKIEQFCRARTVKFARSLVHDKNSDFKPSQKLLLFLLGYIPMLLSVME